MGGNFFFPTYADVSVVELSILLLIVRVVFGIIFITHGINKIKNFKNLSTVFPDPLKVGNKNSLMMAIFGEVVCSLGFITGLLFKFAFIPMIVNMLVAVKVAGGSKKFSAVEPALIYLIIFAILFVAGPGVYALDH